MLGSIELSSSVSETCFVFPSAVCFKVFPLPPLKICTYLLVAQQLLRYTCGMFRRVKTHVFSYTSFHFSERSFAHFCWEILEQGDLFANSIPENIRFKLLMVIVKSFARFDMVWKGWDAWTSLVWCFFFGLKVKRLTSLVFIHSDHTANMGMIDAWWKENTIDLFFKWRDHWSKCRIWHCSHERWYRSS